MTEMASVALYGSPYENPYDLLHRSLESAIPPEEMEFAPNPAYDAYHRMHKVLVGRHGAEKLEVIYNELKQEILPRYLSAAGWAAVESSLVQTQRPIEERLQLLDGARICWQQALTTQRLVNTSELDCLVEHAYPHRIALDLAILPLIEGVVEGKITRQLRKQANTDCLNIAQSNAVQIRLSAMNDNVEALGEHLGFGYECNALLAFNLRFLRGWFIMPSFARSDTGYDYPHQTHDLLVLHHRNGGVVNATPIEIKSSASVRDRQRYKALLVRGKMHLSASGKYTPEETLTAIEAVFEGLATDQQLAVFHTVSERFIDMVRDYNAGEFLGYLASSRSVTRFRDNRQVLMNHPGLSPIAS